jgi:flagellar protein FlaF
MGFSVSGAAALLFAGLLVAFGMWSTAAANGVERVSEAEADRTERLLQHQNSGINISRTGWTGATLIVYVENTGVTQVRVSDTDIIVDGQYTSTWEKETASDLIRPGETVTLNRDFPSQPGRVKVVTGAGVADTLEVS